MVSIAAAIAPLTELANARIRIGGKRVADSMALGGLQIRARAAVLAAAIRAAPAAVRSAPTLVEAWLHVERHQLPLLAPVALGAGIAAWFMLPWADQRLAAAVVAAALVAAGLALRGLSARLLAWGGVLMLAGLGVAEQRSASVAAPMLADRFIGEVAGTVDEIEVASGRDRFRFVLPGADQRQGRCHPGPDPGCAGQPARRAQPAIGAELSGWLRFRAAGLVRRTRGHGLSARSGGGDRACSRTAGTDRLARTCPRAADSPA
jgi:hypothetical protein